MADDDTDYTKFPITARDTLFEVGGDGIVVENKFPMTDVPYGSRLASQIALPRSERQNTKNYHLLGFAPQRALQAEDLNEVQERFMVNNTLTQQMWSNWNSFNTMEISEFGPGWFGTTPMYPHIWKSNIRYLDEFIYSDGNVDDIIYETPKNLISIEHRYWNESVGGPAFVGHYEVQLKLNPGWYYINDTYSTSSTHSSSGFKYWYYLKEPVYSETVEIDVTFAFAIGQWSISSPSHPDEFTVGSDFADNQLCFGIELDDMDYISGSEFQSGDSNSGADRVEVKIKPKLGCGLDDQRTPSYIGYVTFLLEGGSEGVSVGKIRAKYLNNVDLDLTSLNRLNGEFDVAANEDSFNSVAMNTPTTEFI